MLIFFENFRAMRKKEGSCLNSTKIVIVRGMVGIMDQEREVLLLLGGKRKKGILRILFSRIALMLLLMILQVFIWVSVYGWFKRYLPFLSGLTVAFSVGMVLVLFNSAMDSTARLTWLMLIALFPVPGALFYAFTRSNVGNRTMKRLIEGTVEETKTLIAQDEKVLEELGAGETGIEDLAHYLNRTGCFPIYKNTEVTYFPLGEKKYEALLEELEKAQQFIFLEYFILDEGLMWGSVLSILARKASEGVDVRVMYDGMCEISQLPHNYPKRLQKLGIKCKEFSPVEPFVSSHYNYRDHRKILVIDGKVAFNGGINLADEYINKVERFGHWKDTAVMLKGDAVDSFTLLFLQMWNATEHSKEYAPFLGTPREHLPNATGYVMPYGDIPLDEDKVGESVYIDILYRAKEYVHIMTPYLVLDDELKTALKYAAQRGVDVEIIMPGIPDKKTAYALARTYYTELIEAGVKIFEYTPGFVHAKVFVSDDVKAVVGTINLDYRSLYHHFECATYLYKTACIPEIELDFQETKEKCRKVTIEAIRHHHIGYRLLGALMKLVAPLM